MTKGQGFIKTEKCKNKHCSPVSISALCDLNSKSDIIKLLDKIPHPRCNWQKVITFTSHQYMLEGESIKTKLQNVFEGTQTAWNNFLQQHRLLVWL